MSVEYLLVEIAGWTGALLILSGYALLTVGRLNGQSAVYQAMNVVGAGGFIVNGWYHGAIPSVALNVIWMMIGAVALSRISKRRRSSTPAA